MPGGRTSRLMRSTASWTPLSTSLRVLAAAQQDRPLDRVDRLAARDRAAPRRVASTTLATLRTSTGVPLVALTTVFSMSVGRAQVAAPAHDELALAVAAGSRPRWRRSTPTTASIRSLQREPVRAQLRRVGEDVVLLLEAAEADHVGDARRRASGASRRPSPASCAARSACGDRSPACTGRPARPACRWGRACGVDAVGHLGVGQPLGDLLAREVDVDVVLEGDDHLRQAERGDRPLDQHAAARRSARARRGS